MRYQGHHSASSLITRARELRQSQTDAESLVWQMLRGRHLDGLKFRRQHQIDGFILDFYCAELRVAIEIDGAGHGDEHVRAYDALRSEWLRGTGIEVIRFENREVVENPRGVARVILRAVERLRGSKQPPHP